MMRDISISRAKPAIRLTMVSPPIVPVAFRRFIWRAPPVPAFGKSGLAGDLADRAAARLRLLLGKLLEVEAAEIDRLEQQRREAAVLHRLRHDLAGEREKQARRFRQEERLELGLGDVAKREQAGIKQLELEGGLVLGARRDVDLESDLMDAFAQRLGADVELEVHLRLALPLVDRSEERRVG